MLAYQTAVLFGSTHAKSTCYDELNMHQQTLHVHSKFFHKLTNTLYAHKQATYTRLNMFPSHPNAR